MVTVLASPRGSAAGGDRKNEESLERREERSFFCHLRGEIVCGTASHTWDSGRGLEGKKDSESEERRKRESKKGKA
jgi:hypothetical protein